MTGASAGRLIGERRLGGAPSAAHGPRRRRAAARQARRAIALRARPRCRFAAAARSASSPPASATSPAPSASPPSAAARSQRLALERGEFAAARRRARRGCAASSRARRVGALLRAAGPRRARPAARRCARGSPAWSRRAARAPGPARRSSPDRRARAAAGGGPSSRARRASAASGALLLARGAARASGDRGRGQRAAAASAALIRASAASIAAAAARLLGAQPRGLVAAPCSRLLRAARPALRRPRGFGRGARQRLRRAVSRGGCDRRARRGEQQRAASEQEGDAAHASAFAMIGVVGKDRWSRGTIARRASPGPAGAARSPGRTTAAGRRSSRSASSWPSAAPIRKRASRLPPSRQPSSFLAKLHRRQRLAALVEQDGDAVGGRGRARCRRGRAAR